MVVDDELLRVLAWSRLHAVLAPSDELNSRNNQDLWMRIPSDYAATSFSSFLIVRPSPPFRRRRRPGQGRRVAVR